MLIFLSRGIGRSCRIAFLVFTGAALLSACSDSNDSDDLVLSLSCSDLLIGPPPSTCEGKSSVINTPNQYACAVESFQVYPENCISPDLYVTAFADPKANLYAPEFSYAWANSSTNAARYLQMNQKWGQVDGSDLSVAKMVMGIQSYIGFPITVAPALPKTNYPYKIPSSPLAVAVYLLPDGAKAQVPSFETWFKILETDFDVFVPLELQQRMIEPYTRMSKNQDVVYVFTDLTGCEAVPTPGQSPNAVYPEKNWPSTGPDETKGAPNKTCNTEVETALNATGSPACKVGYNNFEDPPCELTTQECFTNFNNNYFAPALANNTDYGQLVGPLRAALAFCQDANPFNTGLGLGYNTAANPFSSKPWDKQTVSDRYTGREFIVKNFETKNLDIAFIYFPFGADTKAGCEKYGGTFDEKQGCILDASGRADYDFLTDGYGFYD